MDFELVRNKEYSPENKWKIDYHSSWSIDTIKARNILQPSDKIKVIWQYNVREEKQLSFEDFCIQKILKQIENTKKHFENYTYRQIFFSNSKKELEKLWKETLNEGIYQNFLSFLLSSIQYIKAETMTLEQLDAIELAFKMLLKKNFDEDDLDYLEDVFLIRGIPLCKIPEDLGKKYNNEE